MTLHIFNTQAQFKSKLAFIHSSLTTDDALLFIEDAVYAAQKHRKEIKCKIFVLEEDSQARAILNKIDKSCKLIDYANFVELSERHKNIISW